MTVWLVTPSAGPLAEEAFEAWREMGYKIAIVVEDPERAKLADVTLVQERYDGYPPSTNKLIRHLFDLYPETQVIVAGADDLWPDPNHHADELERQFLEHFEGGPLGLMQPTGDSFRHEQLLLKCASPWIGRDWCLNGYGGRGAFWPEYFMGPIDLDLQKAVERQGLLWQRHDLVHEHRHFSRHFPWRTPPRHFWRARKFLSNDLYIYRQREEAGFPDSDLAQ